MAIPTTPKSSRSPGSNEASEGVTRLYEPKGDLTPADYDCLALTEAEVTAILNQEK